jgi:hypothetical protein
MRSSGCGIKAQPLELKALKFSEGAALAELKDLNKGADPQRAPARLPRVVLND